MSLPRELLDQLLTGYLDDALSADERARVEQLLQTDNQVVNELAQLREIRASLRTIAQSDAAIRLDAGFANRVLDAAVARARVEGLNEDHPLVRLAEQPSSGSQSHSRSPARSAGLLVGLAASVAIAVVALRPSGDQMAENGSAPVLPTVADLGDGNPPTVPPAESKLVETQPEPFNKLVDSSPAPIPDPSTPVPVETKVAVAEVESPSPNLPNESPNNSMVVSATPEPALQLGAVMVLNVQLTPAGRDSGAVGKAMELASLKPATEKKVAENVANFAKNNLETSTEATVLFLRATTKNLDDFYLHLLSDQEGIQSVGLTISVDAPILAVASSLIDPTQVQHGTATLELLRNGVVDELTQELEQLPYTPLNSEFKNIPTNGADEVSQILVLVR